MSFYQCCDSAGLHVQPSRWSIRAPAVLSSSLRAAIRLCVAAESFRFLGRTRLFFCPGISSGCSLFPFRNFFLMGTSMASPDTSLGPKRVLCELLWSLMPPNYPIGPRAP
jgi:hypothetical protein